MIFSRNCQMLHEQINMEINIQLYLSMSSAFTQIGLDGFAHWTLKQSQEELEHAYKMIDYSIKRGGQVTIGVVNSVPTAWGEPLEIFQHIYEHENCMRLTQSTRLSTFQKRKTRRHKISYGASSESR